jgi:hypothetical protein
VGSLIQQDEEAQIVFNAGSKLGVGAIKPAGKGNGPPVERCGQVNPFTHIAIKTRTRRTRGSKK